MNELLIKSEQSGIVCWAIIVQASQIKDVLVIWGLEQFCHVHSVGVQQFTTDDFSVQMEVI